MSIEEARGGQAVTWKTSRTLRALLTPKTALQAQRIMATSDPSVQGTAPSRAITWCPRRRVVRTRQSKGDRSKAINPQQGQGPELGRKTSLTGLGSTWTLFLEKTAPGSIPAVHLVF